MQSNENRAQGKGKSAGFMGILREEVKTGRIS